MFSFFRKKKLTVNPDLSEFAYSRDAAYLSRYVTQLLFIYCACQTDQSKNNLIDPLGKKLSPGFSEPKFSVWRYTKDDLYPFPIALENKNSTRKFGELSHLGLPSRIRGELWLVRPKAIFELDKLFQNGIFFKRRRGMVHIPYHIKSKHTTTGISVTQFNEYVEAWMYVGRPEFWNDRIDGGYLFQPVNILYENKGDMNSHYYFFNEKFFKNS